MDGSARYFASLALLAGLAACGSSGKSGAGGAGAGQGDDGGAGALDATTAAGDGSSDGGASSDGTGSFGDGAVGEGGGSCTAPDMLVVLDHTDSMSAQPGGGKPANTAAGQKLTKWWLATDAVKAAVAPPLDQKVAYGLELFPLDPATVTDAGGTGTCETLGALLGGTASTNTSCQAAEVLVPPATGTGATITGLLNPSTLRLCVSTPIAQALGTAQAELASIARPGVGQYVLLVTDGAETCKGDVVAVTHQLAAAGVKTFVVGFGSADAGAAGVDVKLLNDAACAGMTAVGFPAPCTMAEGGAGYVATKPGGAPVFYLAQDGASLAAALESITSTICCGCAQ